MWRGFTEALVGYGAAVCDEWVNRGRADAVRPTLLEFTGGRVTAPADLRRDGALPPWLGAEEVHLSHRSALVRKDPAHYRRFFPDVPDDLPYVWPPAAFPRWPVRRGGPALSLAGALARLGWDAPRPGQAEAVARLAAGEDVTLDWPPGSGATSVGLLAALSLPGPTVWVSARGLPDAPPPTVAALRRAGPPRGTARPGRLAESIARPPSAQDLAAVHAEADAQRELHFHCVADLARRGIRAALREASLTVFDGVEPVRRVGRSVVLAVRPVSDAGRRAPSRRASGSPAG
jgi:hypothetical protein